MTLCCSVSKTRTNKIVVVQPHSIAPVRFLRESALDEHEGLMQITPVLVIAPALAATTHVIKDSTNRHAVRVTLAMTYPALSKLDIAGAVYSWATWTFIVFLVSAQFLGIVWNSVEFKRHFVYGQDPHLGLYAISGFNDEPYTDRVFACVEEGRYYRAAQLTDLLATKDAQVVDTTGSSVNAYRLVEREGLVIDNAVLATYSNMCSLIATTMPAITNACEALGYNITKDNLRVVNGIHSNTTHRIRRTLPILAMPFWDNAPVGRFAIPSFDGSACMFRLTNKYLLSADSAAFLRDVNRTVREQKTAELLERPGGEWRNGWYEDQSGEKWNSDMMVYGHNSILDLPMRYFDTLQGEEKDCSVIDNCKDNVVIDHWSAKFTTTNSPVSVLAFAASNGARFGLFYYESRTIRVVTNTYDWETLLSNISVAALLLRWLEVMCALHLGHYRKQSRWHNAGIGCLANLRAFNLLPIVLLPKLKMTLAAFWIMGCEVEGEQKALADAWFAIYPAIVEVVLLYFSLLNIAAKMLRRRISDALFGPTVLFYCLMHWYHLEIAQSGWFGIDGRVPGLILSSEIDRLGLLAFFTTNVPLRMNGNVVPLVAIKLAILGLNILPLLCTRSTAVSEHKLQTLPRLGIEKALAVQCCNLGGLGRSKIYEHSTGDTSVSGRTAITSYEVVRLGYVVYGGRFLISIDHWELLTTLTVLKGVYHLWNHCVALFVLEDKRDGKSIRSFWEMRRLDDPELMAIRWRQMLARPIK